MIALAYPKNVDGVGLYKLYVDVVLLKYNAGLLEATRLLYQVFGVELPDETVEMIKKQEMRAEGGKEYKKKE